MTLQDLVDTADFPLPATRRSIEDRIEKLIELLDVVDDDPDLEDDNDDEPYIGWPEGGPSRLDRSLVQDDREADNADYEATALENRGGGFRYSGPDDSEDNGDREPSLCGTATYLGIGGAGGLEYDLEQDTADEEPSLGATDDVNQDAAWADNPSVWGVDLEQQCEDEEGDSGIADLDALGILGMH